MNIYVQTHDKGIHLIEAFQLLCNKYWPSQPVTVLGYASPDFELAPNFSFVSLGEDTGPKIGGDLIDFFSGIEDEHFIYTVFSQLIIRPVDLRLFRFLADIIENSDRVGRINLVGEMEKDQPYSIIPLQEYDDFALVEHSQASNSRISAVWSMWGKGYFLKYLEPDWDLWQWETVGSKMAKRDGVQILSTFGRYLITPCRVYKRSKLHAGSWRGWDKYEAEMSPEDQEIVRRLVRGAAWQMAGESVNAS